MTLERGPGLDLGSGSGSRRRLSDPGENEFVALPGRQLIHQRIGADPGEVEESTVQGTTELIGAVFASNRRAAFVQHPRQDHIPPQSNAGTSRGCFGQVWSSDNHFDVINFIAIKS